MSTEGATVSAEPKGGRSGRSARRPGRKLDAARNTQILDAALEVLAEAGYEGMTIDAVAARAGAARATVYRRWSTKADLAVDAVRHMSQTDVDRSELPDTGNLRDDLIATIVPQSIDDQQLRIRVMSGLATLSKTDPRLAEAGSGAGLEPWIQTSRTLLQRAVDRNEYPGADVETLAQVIPLMCLARTALQQQPITPEFSLALIDNVLLPAMSGALRPRPAS